MSFATRPRHTWQLRTGQLLLGEQTRIFGIVNVTPDSFSGDGRLSAEAAVEHGLRLLEEGADGLDVGGESTRPGASSIGTAEEQDRVLPVLEGLLRARAGALVSVDTYHAATARAAVTAGAEIVNDVSGLTWDEAMAAACAGLACGVMLMHTRGRPGEWAQLPPLPDGQVLPLVRDGLVSTLDHARRAGIADARIVLDPGYGFGKAGMANFALLARQRELLALGRPLLVGLSRKSFLGQALEQFHCGRGGENQRLRGSSIKESHMPQLSPPRGISENALASTRGAGVPGPQARDQATAAACVAAVLAGASLLRVHAVRAACEAAAVADAVLAAAEQPGR